MIVWVVCGILYVLSVPLWLGYNSVGGVWDPCHIPLLGSWGEGDVARVSVVL